MPKVNDPYYQRKAVPDEFIADVGETGLSRQDEFLSRERKFSTPNGGDVRKFSNPKGNGSVSGKDPYYQRKQVPKDVIHGVGETGLSPEEEFLTRERKYSLADGSDARKFSGKGAFGGTDDPYYGRKQVTKPQINGVGETGQTAAEEYEVRDRKQSMFQLSDDPFDQLAGRHRASVVSPEQAGTAAAAYRRKSSALAPDAMRAAANTNTNQNTSHSGYSGGSKLDQIESKPELPPVNVAGSDLSSTTAGSSTGTNGHQHGGTAGAPMYSGEQKPAMYTGEQQAPIHKNHEPMYYDAATHDDPDSVAPDVRR